MEEPEKNFYRRQSKCKECVKEERRQYYYNNREKVLQQHRERQERNPEEYHEAHRKYYQNNAEKVKARNRKYRENNPMIRLAHNAVRVAIKTGRMVRQICKVFDCFEIGEAHHEDYSKPLDVDWLCLECHRKLERAAV